MTESLDRARSICEQIEVNVHGYMGAPACAEAWATAKLIADLRARVEALEAGLTTVSLELRDRVEALEAAAKPAESNYPAPSHSLVERVADTIYINAMGGVCEQARAAILEIAAWLRSGTDLTHGPQCARWLEDELKKPS